MKPLFQILLALICFHVSAQDITVRYGDFNELPMSDANNLSLYGNAEKQFAVYSHGMGKSKKTTVSLLDKEYKLVRPDEWSLPSPDGEASRMATIKGMYHHGDHYKVFYSAYYTKEKKSINYCSRMDMEGRFDPRVIPLDTVSTKLFTGVSTDIVRSPDETKYALYEFPAMTNRKAMQQLIVHVYDENMRQLYYTGLELPYTANQYSMRSYGVDNFGNAIFIGEIEAKGANDYSIFSYSDKTKKITETKIKRTGEDMRYLLNPMFDLDDKNNLYVTALWGKTSDASKAQGFIISRFNSDGTAIDWTITKNFETDFRSLEDLEDAKTKNFRFDGIYTFGNGEFLFLLEKRWSVDRYDSRGNYSGTTYYANEVVGLRMDNKGSVKYSFVIPKAQMQSNATDMIYSRYIKTDKTLYVMYNDKVDNLDKKPGDKFIKFSSAHNDAGTSVAKVDLATGKYTKSLLTATCPEKDKSPFFDFSTFTKLEDNSYLIKCDITARDKFRFAQLVVK